MHTFCIHPRSDELIHEGTAKYIHFVYIQGLMLSILPNLMYTFCIHPRSGEGVSDVYILYIFLVYFSPKLYKQNVYISVCLVYTKLKLIDKMSLGLGARANPGNATPGCLPGRR